MNRHTNLARSNPPSSSSSPGSLGGGSSILPVPLAPCRASGLPSSFSGGSVRPLPNPFDVPGLLGLARFGGGGLLLGILPAPSPASPLIGLMSRTGRAGVLPMSANFQNCAGELMGINLDGICAVLGGGRRGCCRCGAGVIIDDGPSS